MEGDSTHFRTMQFFCISNMGIKAIRSDAKGEKHQDNLVPLLKSLL